jgi:hypothetical protein
MCEQISDIYVRELHVQIRQPGDVLENNGELCSAVGWHSVCPPNGYRRERGKPITRTLMALTLTCIALFAAPVAANAAGLVVTEPGMLIALGIALVGVGLGTRKLWTQRRKS